MPYLPIVCIGPLPGPSFPVSLLPSVLPQIPLELGAKSQMTVSLMNVDVVVDAQARPADIKRFATLNLAIPMWVSPGGGNLPKPHLIFAAPNHVCTPASEWKDQDEVSKYHPASLVTFQSNVRSRTGH